MKENLKMRKRHLAATAALVVTPFVGAPAWATTCTTASVATYVSQGSCTYDGLTFSGVSVSATETGGGSFTAGNITPFSTVVGGTTETGLSLNYTAFTGTSGGTVDVSWIFNVAGNLLTDAFASLTGIPTGSGSIAEVSENFTNGSSITLLSPGTSQVVTYTPIASLGVTKDQFDYAASGSTSETSILQDGFSLTTTPIPATLPLLATGLFGLWGVSRKRRKGSRLGSTQAA
jgi:hypothetical protein